MYAVIFKAQLRDMDDAYYESAKRLRELATQEYGCLEFVSVAEGDREISISYWETLEQIQHWKRNAEHLQAQALGKSKWYGDYQIEVVEIVRQYALRDVQ